MSTAGGPKRHARLSREAIARTALELVDQEGAAALSVRSVAARLGVGAMSLYRHVEGRDAMVADVVALLLDEIDLNELPGVTWQDGAKAVGRALRAMALRHPKAFELVAAAASDRPPLVGYAARLRRFYLSRGVPAEAFEEVWSILDAFETGFLLLETQALIRPPAGAGDEADALDAETRELSVRMPRTLGEAAYEEGMTIIVDGLARRLAKGPAVRNARRARP